jgi:pyruvate/2-oxoglutarate dehydrogenase complex dihydrolipoamide acyltransferase (E2) component
MSVEILLPKLGFAMSEGTVSEWLVPDGATVAAGDALYTFESDKAVEEVPAPSAGKLKILVRAGETCPVGALLGLLD